MAAGENLRSQATAWPGSPGALLIGIGEETDLGKTMRAEPGDTGTAPVGAPHYTIAKGRTRVRVTFMGPYTITYLHAEQAPAASQLSVRLLG